MASNGLVVYSSESLDYSLPSPLLPLKMTLITGIYCYVLIAIFFANCETKTVLKDKWITTSIRINESEAQTHLRLRREKSTLGDVCNSHEDCNRHINNSECRHSKCECKTEFIRSENTDLSLVCNKFNNSAADDLRHENTPVLPSSPHSTHMLVIMVVLGLMFIGMCVALNLFSRARFRNHRSVFSNPRMIDMAKAQEGRATQLRKVENSRGSSDFEVES